MQLFGDANDYVGKGLSGGRIVVRPHRGATLVAEENVIAGNVIAYGATTGAALPARHRRRALLRAQLRCPGRRRGRRRPRLRVHDRRRRPSCSAATGRNFAAGMSGGVAYVLDLDRDLVNPELVDLMPLRPDDETHACASCSTAHVEWTESPVARGAARRLGERPASASPSCCRATTSASSTSAPRPRPQGLDLDGPDVWNRIMEASRG